jgi:Domain of unknown function (DUF4279)
MANAGDFEIKTKLVVLGYECPAEQISQILGVAPSKAWLRGERILEEAQNVYAESGWELKSPADPRSTTVEDSIRRLIESLPDPAAFRTLPQGCEIQLTSTIYAYRERPFVYLPAELILRIAAIGASLDVDIYDVSDQS